MNKKNRVLHVVNLKSFGGIQKLVMELANEINKSTSVSNDLLSISGVDLFKDRMPLGLNIMECKEGSFFKKISAIKKIMDNYDIIHFHGPYSVFQVASLFVKRKFIYTEHGTLQKPNIKNNLKHFLQKRLLGIYFLKRKANVVIFLSPWLIDDLKFVKSKSVVVNNGIKFIVPIATRKEDQIIISIAARLIPKKRVDLAIDVMHRLKEHKNIVLHIIGDGIALNSLKKRAGDLLDETVFFLGYRSDAYDLIAASHFYLMTTDKEPFGLVVLEAMMSGSIVFCLRDSGGPVEFLGENFPELIFDSVDEIADGIIKYSNDDGLMKSARARLKDYYFDNFTISAMANNYIDVYLKCFENEY